MHQRLGLEQHAAGLVELIVDRTSRLGIERLAKRRRPIIGSELPLAAEEAFEKVTLN